MNWEDFAKGIGDIDRIDFEKEAEKHPSIEECEEYECLICGWRDCPYYEPFHYLHDGCPVCSFKESEE